MQATGETTIEKMNRDASLAFTSKTKALVKSLTGSESTDDNANPNPNPNDNTGGENQGGTNTGGDSGSIIDGTDEG
jgi:hypothetical protein